MPRDVVTKRFLQVIPDEKRVEILQDAIESLTKGEPTDQIAARHDIDGGLLRTWLLVDDTANQARSLYFAGELDRARQTIKEAQDPLTLARGREDFRSIAWLAERRNAAHWGQTNNIQVSGKIEISHALAEISAKRLQADVSSLQQTGDVALLPLESVQIEPDDIT